jgi:hypothetical protein
VNITLDIKCPELAQAINNLAAAMGNRQLQAPEASPEPEKPKTAARSAKADKTTPSTPEQETDAGAGEASETTSDRPAAQSPSDDASGSDIDYAQVKAAVMKVSTTKGRQAAVDLLGEFNAKVGGDLTEEQWGPFLARAEEALG